ncbi:MAG: hypothetical protein AYK18_07450 [Theionarchaea archaeon DG-70]|nr:MAG: hypothetical protein AYK18_07450 [Theionarchaea archaeon DG-70]
MACVMSREQRTSLISRVAGVLWILLSHRYTSLRFNRVFPVVKEAFSCYEDKLNSLGNLPHCMNYAELLQKGFFKEKYWKFGLFMAAATSLPVLYNTVNHQDIIGSVCAKASVSTSAKLLDNLNDTVHSYQEAFHSLSEYKCALQKGTYSVENPSLRAEQSAHEIATWVHHLVPSTSGDNLEFAGDVDRLVEGQIASLQHKKDQYPSMKEYLSRICDRSIGNVWIDMDLALLGKEKTQLKKGNEYIFKSYLIYDDVQDISGDLESNSVNSAVILGLERGILSEGDIRQKSAQTIIQELKKAHIFEDLLCLGDVVFLKGLTIIKRCDSVIDEQGLAASLSMIRMFNIRRILRREKTLDILNTFLANHRWLEKVKQDAPEYIVEMVKYVS